MTIAAWPPTISMVVFLQTVTDRNNFNGTQLFNIGAISNREESSCQMKVGSLFSMVDGRVRVWQRRGERYADACVMARETHGQSITEPPRSIL